MRLGPYFCSAMPADQQSAAQSRAFLLLPVCAIVICFALALAIFGSVSCSTPSTCFGLRRIGIDRLRQADRPARLAEGPLFPKRLAVRFDFIAELGADGDIAVFDVDFDLVLGDARQLCLDDVGFRRFDDVQRDGCGRRRCRAFADGSNAPKARSNARSSGL